MNFEPVTRLAKVGTNWFNSHNGWFKNNNDSTRLERSPIINNEASTSFTDPPSSIKEYDPINHGLREWNKNEASTSENTDNSPDDDIPAINEQESSSSSQRKLNEDSQPKSDTSASPTPGNEPTSPSSKMSLPAMDLAAQVAATASAPIDFLSTSNNIKQDSKIMGEYYQRESGANGTYLGMKQHAQMIANARQSGRAYAESGRKLGGLLGGLPGALIGHFAAKKAYDNGLNNKYLKDYNFKTLSTARGDTIDPRDHETSNWNNSKDSTYSATHPSTSRSAAPPATGAAIPGPSSYKLGNSIGNHFSKAANMVTVASTGTQTDNSVNIETPSTSTA